LPNKVLNVPHIIGRKRDGIPLGDGEIESLIEAFARDRVSDEQMAAFAMAVYFRGMSDEETAALTRAMLRSGRSLDWSACRPPKVDKHSTGGVGDKVSLVLAPLLAACGLCVPMISGRGLGFTGGTIDKLEAIPGLRVDLSLDAVQRQVESIGCVITGTTHDLAPADRKLYAIRDVTATVESVPLITASIMSKKLAETLHALVLDVKFGTGAFMKDLAGARQLARALFETGLRAGVATSALITDMNQPLGRTIGHALEVNEAIAALQGSGPHDLMELTLSLGAEAMRLAGASSSTQAARTQLTEAIAAGRAWERFRQMVVAQGGDLDADRPLAPASDVCAESGGYVVSIDGERLGRSVIELGGGRKAKHHTIDHSVGLEMLVRLGDAIERGQPLVRVFAPRSGFETIERYILAAIDIGPAPPAAVPLIAEQLVCGAVAGGVG
jgi:pyrimidine-nucleoside phosphorylase